MTLIAPVAAALDAASVLTDCESNVAVVETDPEAARTLLANTGVTPCPLAGLASTADAETHVVAATAVPDNRARFVTTPIAAEDTALISVTVTAPLMASFVRPGDNSPEGLGTSCDQARVPDALAPFDVVTATWRCTIANPAALTTMAVNDVQADAITLLPPMRATPQALAPIAIWHPITVTLAAPDVTWLVDDTAVTAPPKSTVMPFESVIPCCQ